jgi:hypothetical protein
MNTPLPSPWVDSLFARLTVSYGRNFLSQYEGIDIAAVKADWANQLGWCKKDVDGKAEAPAIAWALENLIPGKPPTSLEFRKLCCGYNPPDTTLALPAPVRPVPEKFKREVERLVTPVQRREPEGMRVARNYIAKWGHPDSRATARQKSNVAYYENYLRQTGAA